MREHESFQELLMNILGNNYVYFQPPASVTLRFPCIVYSLDNFQPQHADNKKFILHKRYTVTYISKNPMDAEILEKLEELQYSSLDRHYEADNLHHYVYTIYY